LVIRATAAAEQGEQWGNMLPHLFLKVKKVPHLENEKSISGMNALFCWKESALFAVVKTL
jgi:hypothetical protein